jgi:hypothetical protein
MERLVSLVSDATDPRVGGADSYSDQLSCIYTVYMLSVFTLVVATRQFVSEPISCWCPTEFSGDQIDYVNKVLYI